MTPAPSIRSVQTPRGLVVEIGGDHDLRTVPDIHAAIETAGPELWLVDLTACSFIDSTVVSELANRPAVPGRSQAPLEPGVYGSGLRRGVQPRSLR
jgi:hypothetical protein